MKIKKNKNVKKIIFLIFCTILSFCSLIPLVSCSDAYAVIFGNFNSYISPVVQKQIENKNDINWQSYNSNFEVPSYIINKTLNMSVVTTNMVAQLANNKLIKNDIDYSCFLLLNPDTNQVITKNSEMSSIFTNETYDILTNGYSRFNINLLDYCFPYFLQNFVFVYRGEQIPELHKPDVKFSDIFNVIKNEKRFKTTKNSHNILMIDDPRTMFGLSEILKDEKNEQEVNINPDKGILNDESDVSINEFNDQFKFLLETINSSNDKDSPKFGLNADSNIILNKIARNEIVGGFMYNGDAIFAALGGDYSSEITPSIKDFHIVVPKNTIVAMDAIVLNKQNTNKENLDCLKIAYELTLAGTPINEINDLNKPYNLPPDYVPKLSDITQYDTNTESYYYLPMENFNYINYTPVLKSIYNYATTDYFADQPLEFKQMLENSFKINLIKDKNTNEITNIELPLNDLTNSNLKIAYYTFKNDL